jgi:hypothetical protein
VSLSLPLVHFRAKHTLFLFLPLHSAYLCCLATPATCATRQPKQKAGESVEVGHVAVSPGLNLDGAIARDGQVLQTRHSTGAEQGLGALCQAKSSRVQPRRRLRKRQGARCEICHSRSHFEKNLDLFSPRSNLDRRFLSDRQLHSTTAHHRPRAEAMDLLYSKKAAKSMQRSWTSSPCKDQLVTHRNSLV